MKTNLDMEKIAKESNDYGKYVACGQAYLDIYNRNPEATENDEVLYNAGVCFSEGKSIGAEIQAYNLLEKYYPNSKLTAKAVALLGKAYGDIAYYDRARRSSSSTPRSTAARRTPTTR
jgi:hypothetical protein